MYIEALQTPHPKLAPNEERATLTEAAGVNEAQAYIESAPDKEAATREVVDYIQEQVRRTLRRPYHNQSQKVSLDSLRATQITNCLGYAVAGSECLDAAGINHYIGYVNRHALILRPSDDGGLHVVDMFLPRFNHDIASLLSHGSATSIIERAEDEEAKRGAAMLDTYGLASMAAHVTEKSTEEILGDHPWLTATKDTLAPDNYASQARLQRKYRCVLSVFRSDIGRKMLHDYEDFRYAVEESNLSLATRSLHNMRGLYPEIDARASHREINHLVRELCVLNRFDQATKAVEDYCLSFAPSNDARLKGLEGDLFRKISEASEDETAATLSRQAYETARSRTHCGGFPSEMYLGKIMSTNSLAKASIDGQ